MIGGIGHFDKLGNACLEFHLCGMKHPLPGVKFTGIIDTGFTGFIQLPMQHAFSLGLPLEGTVNVQYADGSKSVCVTCTAEITFEGQKEWGVVTLAPNAADILLGMDFLRRFDLALVMRKKSVSVISEALLDQMEAKAASSSGSSPATPLPPPPSSPEPP